MLPSKINESMLRVTMQDPVTHAFFGTSADADAIIPQLAEYRKAAQHGSDKTEMEYNLDTCQMQPTPRISTTENIFSDFTSGLIIFFGPVGSGKSTFLKTVARNVINKKYESLKEIEIVIFLQCFDLDANSKSSPCEHLLSYVTNLTEDDQKNFAQVLKKTPNKVLFILDELDTFPGNLNLVKKAIQKPIKPATSAQTLYSLLHCKLFPGCRVITSVRNFSVEENERFKPEKVVRLAGLTINDMYTIVKARSEEGETTEIMDELHRNQALLKLCHQPLILVLFLFGRTKNQTPITPKISHIIIRAFQKLLANDVAKKSEILQIFYKLQCLTYKLTCEGKITFTVKDVTTAGLDVDRTEALAVVTSAGPKNEEMRFTHRLFQDMLVALHVAGMTYIEMDEFGMNFINSPKFRIVRRILCGIICNKRIFEEAASFFKDKYIMEKHVHVHAALFNEIFNFGSQKDPNRVLQLLTSSCEGSETTLNVVSNFMNRISLRGPFVFLSPFDLHVVGVIINHWKKLEKLEIINANLRECEISLLHETISQSHTEISHIDVSGNDITPAGLGFVGKIAKHCRTKNLDASICSFLTSDHLEALKNGLSSGSTRMMRPFQLERLNISRYSKTKTEEATSIPFVTRSAAGARGVQRESLGNTGSAPPLDRTEGTYDVVYATARLFPYVRKEIVLHEWKINESLKQILQSKLNKSSMFQQLSVHFTKDDSIFSKFRDSVVLQSLDMSVFSDSPVQDVVEARFNGGDEEGPGILFESEEYMTNASSSVNQSRNPRIADFQSCAQENEHRKDVRVGGSIKSWPSLDEVVEGDMARKPSGGSSHISATESLPPNLFTGFSINSSTRDIEVFENQCRLPSTVSYPRIPQYQGAKYEGCSGVNFGLDFVPHSSLQQVAKGPSWDVDGSEIRHQSLRPPQRATKLHDEQYDSVSYPRILQCHGAKYEDCNGGNFGLDFVGTGPLQQVAKGPSWDVDGSEIRHQSLLRPPQRATKVHDEQYDSDIPERHLPVEFFGAENAQLDDIINDTKSSTSEQEHEKDNSLPKLLEVQIAHCCLNERRIQILASKLVQCQSVDEIELRDCELDSKLLDEFAKIVRETECEIDKFSVSLAENLIDLLPGVCKILKLHDTETLNLTENNITGQDLTELQRHLNDLKVTSLCGLDLSNNENLGNLEQLGFLVLSRGLTDLTLMSCELTDDQLEILSAFQCSTVKSLNISHNRDITEKGLRCLEKLLQPHNIDYLDVSGCEMMRDKLLGLKDLFNNRKVMKLNCSYNDFRCDEMTLLGEMSTTAKVCEISVAGCDLDEIHLNAFSEALGNHKFDRVDAADNSGINGGMEEVAKLAKQCSSLDISECRIQPEGIDSFCRAMDKNAIETLNVSDSNRRLTGKGRALKSLLKLIPIVSKRLLLCFENVDTASRESLETHLESSPNKELRIVFDQSLYCETQNGISFAMKKEEDSLKL